MKDTMDPLKDTLVPTPETQRQFRTTLGCFATGVTVVTVGTDAGPLGMTANSFSSVSMDPPLVLWCPAHSSERYMHFAKASHFAIHILHAGQEALALDFARNGNAFESVAHDISADGVPILRDCLARMECSTHAIHPAGDHDIIVGRVLRFGQSEGTPLVFSQSAFGRFSQTL